MEASLSQSPVCNGGKCFPNFLIIGVQKAGTTTLYNYLSALPGFCGSSDKETGYFTKDKFFQQGARWYAERFAHCDSCAVTFEATPNYIWRPDAPGRISSFNPNVKLIVIFREPAQRCYSAWNMFRRFNEEGGHRIYQHFTQYTNSSNREAISALLFAKHFPSFRQVVQDDIERYRSQSGEIEPSFVRRGIYHEQIARYLDFFDIDSFLFVEQGELNDPTSLSMRLSEFLGVTIDPGSADSLVADNVAEYLAASDDEKAVLADLRTFYMPHNKRLYEMIGVEYPWQDSEP